MSTKQKQYKGRQAKEPDAGINSRYMIAGILVATFLVYFNITSADFLNWDDINFVLGNSDITSLGWHNIQKMFTSYAMGNYCPLAILSYAIDYQIGGGLNAKVFHSTSLLIHLVNTFLVFVLIYRLSSRQLVVAAIVSLLFGIHPMHVESVAWIAERRDVLYTLFYLLGLIAYTRYTASKNEVKYLVYTLLFFVGSLLSKGQAVTFPLVLFIIDYMQNRFWNLKVFSEKIPFLLLSLLFGFIAIVAQKTTPAVNVVHLSLLKSLVAGSYGFLIYLIKSFVPFNLSGYHPYPFKSNDAIPWFIYAAPLVIVLAGVFIYRNLKTDRQITGGILIFCVTIFPVLQFLPVGQAIVAERYSYVPYMGLFYLVGHVYKNKNNYSVLKNIQSVALYILVGYLLVLGVITYKRVQVWRDSISFWSDVIEKYPECSIAYNSRGYMYNEFKKYDLAIEDFNKGIPFDTTYARIYLNRGVAYNYQKRNMLALADYNTSIRLDSTEPKTFLYRGILYTDQLNQPDSGIMDFKKVLQINPQNIEAITNLGVAYYKKEDYKNALEQFSKSIQMDAENGRTYYLRSLVYAGQKDYVNALNDASKCKQLGVAIDEVTVKQWESFAGSNLK